MHGLPCPPAKLNEEGHPEQYKLNAKVNGASPGKHSWRLRFAEKMADERIHEIENRHESICGDGDKRKEDKTKPSERVRSDSRMLTKNSRLMTYSSFIVPPDDLTKSMLSTS
jgi:hypothetical protein